MSKEAYGEGSVLTWLILQPYNEVIHGLRLSWKCEPTSITLPMNASDVGMRNIGFGELLERMDSVSGMY